jgi:polyisoprenoid-binding protein YceI
MMITTVRGKFSDVTATAEIDEEHPERSRVEARIGTASVSSGLADRDNHLRSADFFDSERFPHMTFRSTQVRPTGEGEFYLIGDLTIRDVTREVLLEGELSGPVADFTGARRIGVSLRGEINREDFGLVWNAVLEAGTLVVGKQVKISIDVEAVEATIGAEAAVEAQAALETAGTASVEAA